MTPDASDALSDVLRRFAGLRWCGGMTTIGPDWAIDVPADFGCLYFVARGATLLRTPPHVAGSAPLRQGDFALLLHGTSHRLGDAATALPFEPAAFVSPPASASGDEPRGAVVVYGFIRLAAFWTNPFVRVVPEFMRLAAQSTPLLQTCLPLASAIAQERRTASPGWSAIVGQLVHVLFLQTLRAHLSSRLCDAGSPNWLSAALDPTIGRLLVRLHDEPQRPWTVRAMAKETNLARSAFAEHFHQVVGEPPLKYLTEYRMHKACELLYEPGLSVQDIAERVGYNSASSFSNAFKRLVQKSPAEFRKHRDLAEARNGRTA